MTEPKMLQLCRKNQLDDNSFSWVIIFKELRKYLPNVKYQGYRWDMCFREIPEQKSNKCPDVWLILTVSSLAEPLGNVSLRQPFKVSIINDSHEEIWSVSTMLSQTPFLPATTAWMNDLCLVLPGTVVLDLIVDSGKNLLKLSFLPDARLEPEQAMNSSGLGFNNQAQCKEYTEFAEDIKALLLEPDDFDVSLDVSGKTFKAHKNILKARSPVFKRMFSHNMTELKSGLVEITDCDPTAFEAYLQYIYSGNFDGISSSNVSNLHLIANKYGPERLEQQCLEFMKDNLEVEKFCDFVSAVLLNFKASSYLDDAVEFFADNFREVLDSTAWKTFIQKNPLEGNELTLKAYDKIF